MIPSPESLRKHYAELEDEALLQAAMDRDALTPEARSVLLEELQLRGLTVPSVSVTTSATMPPDAPVWITVDRFRDLSTAIVARAALEAAEIPCFLRDENTVRLDWQISNFIGGMRLQVLEQDEAAARAVLQNLTAADTMSGEGDTLEPEEHCPFCGSGQVHRIDPSIGLRAAALWLFALPLPRRDRFWRCSHCHKEFPERDLALHGSTSSS